jgi:UDP-glucose:(heptosyl)LPS alpha-1,3-glucosyltransferase
VVAVAGRGEKAPYVSLARKKGVNADRMFFAGHVKDIEKWYGMADVFVLPSRYEPFANVCLEAMACGLPVITTKTNGASEIITPGEDGFILEDWKDSATLSTFLSRLADKDLLRKMGEKAARKATGFTWERHLEEMERVLTVFREQN